MKVPSPDTDPRFEALLEYLKRNRGFDFSGYKRLSLTRRVLKRMQMLGISEFSQYIDYLEVHSDEFVLLFNTILINVSRFFRDQDAWDYLSSEILPALLASVDPQEPIRIWSAGCSAGQEAYTAAMVLCEMLGQQAFHERVKIYATDVDEESLAQARQATYSKRELEDVPPALFEKYFTPVGETFAFRSDLRRSVIFGRHDLVQDPPISHIDLLMCRNALMYFNAETQSRIITRMHFALKDGGYLFLGKAEMLLSHTDLFSQIDVRHRLFTKVVDSSVRRRAAQFVDVVEAEPVQYETSLRLSEMAFEATAKAYLVLDKEGRLVLANARARRLLGVLHSDIGKQFQDLEVSYRPIELRSIVEEVRQRPRSHIVANVPRRLHSELQYLDLTVAPVFGSDDTCVAISIAVEDVSDFYKLKEQLQTSHEILLTTNEELQSTNEELETTNEELQSTNEELETTNEEVQSTNDELETTNEELNSSNAELETMNQELQVLMSEVNDTNEFLDTLLSSMRSGLIALDSRLHVLAWNPRCAELWGLDSDDVAGKSLKDLDIGLPFEAIADALSRTRREEHHRLTVQARNRRGKEIVCYVRIAPLHDEIEQEGVVILIDEQTTG